MNSTFGTSQQRATVGGNQKLNPEKGVVATAGVVYEPLRGLDVTLDYWHIQIDNAITTLLPQTILAQLLSGWKQELCDQIQRDPVTHGISHLVEHDPERRWHHDLGSRLLRGVPVPEQRRYLPPRGRGHLPVQVQRGHRHGRSELDAGADHPRA